MSTFTGTDANGVVLTATIPSDNASLMASDVNVPFETLLNNDAALQTNANSRVLRAGDTMTGALSITAGGSTGSLVITSGATTPAVGGYISLGNGGFNGGAGNFAGSANGTVNAVDMSAGFLGNLADYQVNGVSEFRIGNGDPL